MEEPVLVEIPYEDRDEFEKLLRDEGIPVRIRQATNDAAYAFIDAAQAIMLLYVIGSGFVKPLSNVMVAYLKRKPGRKVTTVKAGKRTVRAATKKKTKKKV